VQPPSTPPVLPPVPLSPSDHFAKVRSLGGTLVVMLALRASMRVITYIVHKVTSPPPGEITGEQYDSMRMVETGLLGIENLVTIVAMITFLVWIHRVFVAIRASGGTTSWSPGWAVGGWFIPLANAVLPWLTVRDALKALQRPTILAGAWWITWLIVIPLTMLQNFSRQMMIMPELGAALRDLPAEAVKNLFELVNSSFWPYFILDTGVWVLLLLIVSTIRKAGPSQG
jgi:Domain of unknown function (DUF4328)